MNKYEERLTTELLARSMSKDWDTAKTEWFLHHVMEGVSTCICGKNPIQKICILENKYNKDQVILGSTCVEKYMFIKCEHIFTDMAALRKGRFVKLATLDYAKSRGFVNDWEYGFYLNLQKFKKLSEKQMEKFDSISRRLEKLLGVCDK